MPIRNIKNVIIRLMILGIRRLNPDIHSFHVPRYIDCHPMPIVRLGIGWHDVFSSEKTDVENQNSHVQNLVQSGKS